MSDQEIAQANPATNGAAAEESAKATRRRRKPADAPAETPVALATPPAPVLTVLPDLGEIEPQEEEYSFRVDPAPRSNHVAPALPAPPEPPEEVTVVLVPVELLNAERRGELVHLTLGAGVTLCGTPCDPEPASSRPYSVASGCQRCARMIHRLKARCASCGRPLLHLAGNGACIRCGHVGAVIQLL